MNYDKPEIRDSLASLAQVTKRSAAGARRDLEGYLTYLDAAEGLAWLLHTGKVMPKNRPAIDCKGGMWWITLEGEAGV